MSVAVSTLEEEEAAAARVCRWSDCCPTICRVSSGIVLLLRNILKAAALPPRLTAKPEATDEDAIIAMVWLFRVSLGRAVRVCAGIVRPGVVPLCHRINHDLILARQPPQRTPNFSLALCRALTLPRACRLLGTNLPPPPPLLAATSKHHEHHRLPSHVRPSPAGVADRPQRVRRVRRLALRMAPHPDDVGVPTAVFHGKRALCASPPPFSST